MKTRCSKCSWVHEADSVADTSFMGVELCQLHASAQELLEACHKARGALNAIYKPEHSIFVRDVLPMLHKVIAKAESTQDNGQ